MLQGNPHGKLGPQSPNFHGRQLIVFVECSRVRATALGVLWRVYDGVEAKQRVAHTCFLVLFSYQPSAPKNEQVPLTPVMSTHPTALPALQARLPKGCYSSMDHNASGIEPPTPTDWG